MTNSSAFNPSDLPRRIESTIRTGVVIAVDHAGEVCRVSSGELETDWLHWLTFRAGATRSWCPPTVGEQCIVLSPSGETGAGLVLLGLFSDTNPSPSHSPDEHLTVYPDGAQVLYNHATGALQFSGVQSALIEAAGTITLRAGGEIKLDAPQTTSTGKHTVKGLLSYLAGLAGWGDGGAGSVINGPLTQQGGNLTSNGIVLHTHKHTGVQAGASNTGGPSA
ncbi:phage baseplate assembly protein V [Andreprevotia lacus DSM 23236]|jgi:phage baseplate assembly protein V|uniref:Phage baseplate assembly protein V n=1 Tax=Andreprevotia lacus DSM 23236 TaxID=1121001 RepID=A0A1W1XJV0_9NEIS|nr:phage baseplate assembly protein V [Andreprevotia lacus]SMC24225.1 phage baseplate assembly protein V [Andreprevotia lacus DSM 23236]